MKRRKNDVMARVAAERSAHETHDVLGESYRLKDRFSHVWTYPSRLEMWRHVEDAVACLSGKTVLDYGCGRGEASLKYLEAGATVYGIDIAQNYISDARSEAEKRGYPQDRWSFQVMDAHRLTFPDEYFDVIIGNGILHHLDTELAVAEIHRVLKPKGRVLLFEPLADNPLLRIFRRLTPNARTEDEAPFTKKDLLRIADNRRWDSQTRYCGALEAPVAVATSLVMKNHPDNRLLKIAHVFEKKLHTAGLLASWNQYVLFDLIKRHD